MPPARMRRPPASAGVSLRLTAAGAWIGSKKRGLNIKNRPLSVHHASVVILPVERVRKLSASMHVEVVDSQEVFGRHADEIPSQPHSGYPWWVTENMGHWGTLRQPSLLRAGHTHGNAPAGRAHFDPRCAPVGAAKLTSHALPRTVSMGGGSHHIQSQKHRHFSCHVTVGRDGIVPSE